MRLLKLALFALLACLTLAASAQVYRWVDKNGKVHYSDKPPPKTTPAERMDIQTKPTDHTANDKELAELADRAKMTEETAALRERDAKAAAAEKELKQKRCDDARANATSLEQANQLVSTDKDGKRVYGTSAQLDAERAAARQAVAELCK